MVNFEFILGGKTFHQLWLLVDGIYPELGRFAKTIDELIVTSKKLYASWQESSRKDVEREFGVLQRKFQVLRQVVEWWFLNNIKVVVEPCVILHNMMVEQQTIRDETEYSSFYLYDTNVELNSKQVDNVVEDIARAEAEME
jgi:Plant transposon protein